ncbi:hypothetical protein Pint_19892 [Pistacia integerrima]|uniref:Uncharacterized protein n=1 Tax=Pistacia integerrima TaxID=434235 RepID=A0ACC0XB36_9ROSI|nr:hypothetical protein Pint_19892 [Pistacia integerrima]
MVDTDKVYFAFHDESWGVPLYDDKYLHLKSKHLVDNIGKLLRDSIRRLLPKGEKQILEILSDKAILLAESRVRCILDNAKWIMKIMNEFRSFSSFMWGYVNYKPVINKYRYPRNVPLRTPKVEAISKDLLKEGSNLLDR